MTMRFRDGLLQPTKLTEAELVGELALALFQSELLTLGQAAQLCGLRQLEFQRLLVGRQIPIHYGLEEMRQVTLPAQNVSHS